MSYGSDTLDALDALARSHGPLIVAVTVAILVWLASIALTGWAANRRNRDGGNWATLAMFLGPAAFVVLIVMPKPKRGPALSPLWAKLESTEPAANRSAGEEGAS